LSVIERRPQLAAVRVDDDVHLSFVRGHHRAPHDRRIGPHLLELLLEGPRRSAAVLVIATLNAVRDGAHQTNR